MIKHIMEVYMKRGSEWRKWDLHVHTASSYDYKYKSEEANEKLVQAWRENELSVVAITDHFIIDADRIRELQRLAPEVTILPGVELRCDKGAPNFHIILIFDNKEIRKLANDFDVIMKNRKAKNSEDVNRIYWDYTDIIEFAKDNNGIISVHAGKKDKGIDKVITNALEINMAIKEEISQHTDIFEMGKKTDIGNYIKYVFKDIKKKPMIICSDNHDARDYKLKENLWIKSDSTFDGLLQAIKEPELRFFVGELPGKLSIINKKSEKFIDSIEIKGKSASDMWFDNEIPLNYDLVTIIGNKGNGKSALADIIAYSGNTHNEKFSFLSNEKFNQKSNKLGLNYEVKIKWKNGIEDKKNLCPSNNSNLQEKVKYLPQQYIEYVCNDLKNGFNDEIERLIFDYLPKEKRLDKNSLNELIKYVTESMDSTIDLEKLELRQINTEILKKEFEISNDQKNKLKNKLDEYEKELNQMIDKKPTELKKPCIAKTIEDNLNNYHSEIDKKKSLIEQNEKELGKITKKEHIFNEVFNSIEKVKSQLVEWCSRINKKLSENEIEKMISYEFNLSCNELKKLQEENVRNKEEVKQKISTIEEDNFDGVLIVELKEIESRIKEIKDSLSSEQMKYQKYLEDNNKYQEKITQISNNKSDVREEIRRLNEDIPKQLEQLYEKRKNICNSIYKLKQQIVEKYKEMYSYINSSIDTLNIDKGEKPNIEINFYINTDKMGKMLFQWINQKIKSIFRGTDQGREKLLSLVEEIKLDEFDSLYKCLEKIEKQLKDSVEEYENVFFDKNKFYESLYGLDYVSVSYQMKLGNKLLNKLSPGERGLLLLIFYLLLDKDDCPLIIDQPEDNLDNQSIFNKLVKYIIQSKTKRQIIIVTHNPNIAVACDSEQIIYSCMNKEKSQIRYESNSMESTEMKQNIVDVLEGTMPAFEKRSSNYQKN